MDIITNNNTRSSYCPIHKDHHKIKPGDQLVKYKRHEFKKPIEDPTVVTVQIDPYDLYCEDAEIESNFQNQKVWAGLEEDEDFSEVKTKKMKFTLNKEEIVIKEDDVIQHIRILYERLDKVEKENKALKRKLVINKRKGG